MKPLLILALLAACAWGVGPKPGEIYPNYDPYNAQNARYDEQNERYAELLKQLARIEARLDRLEHNQPAPSRVRWSVEYGCDTLKHSDHPVFRRGDVVYSGFYLYATLGSRKFRVCKD